MGCGLQIENNYWEKRWKTHFEPAQNFFLRYFFITYLVKVFVALAIAAIILEKVNLNDDITFFFYTNSVSLFSFFVANFIAIYSISRMQVKGKRFTIVESFSGTPRNNIKILKLVTLLTVKTFILSAVLFNFALLIGFGNFSFSGTAVGLLSISVAWIWSTCFPSAIAKIQVEFVDATKGD